MFDRLLRPRQHAAWPVPASPPATPVAPPVDGTVVIDCDAPPYVPAGWSVAVHRPGGLLTWTPETARQVLEAGLTDRAGPAAMPAPNANLLDYLLARPALIPADWKADGKGRSRYVVFSGTVYRNIGGRITVRYLCWLGDRWGWMGLWLGFDSCCFIPAVLRRG